MSDQLELGGTESSAGTPGRVNILARMLLGFVAPGFDSWDRAPRPLRDKALTAARTALEDVERTVNELHKLKGEPR